VSSSLLNAFCSRYPLTACEPLLRKRWYIMLRVCCFIFPFAPLSSASVFAAFAPKAAAQSVLPEMRATARHHKTRVRQFSCTQGPQHIINISGHSRNNADTPGLNQTQQYFADPAAHDQARSQLDQLVGLPYRVCVGSCNFTASHLPSRLNLNQKDIAAPVKDRGNAIFKDRYDYIHYTPFCCSGRDLFIARSAAASTK